MAPTATPAPAAFTGGLGLILESMAAHALAAGDLASRRNAAACILGVERSLAQSQDADDLAALARLQWLRTALGDRS